MARILDNIDQDQVLKPEARIASLVADSREYVLVCADCLSEDINLQQHFNVPLYYDLAWNPTRHEQREGRVDRFGQEKTEASRTKVRVNIRPVLPVETLGAYILLPMPGNGRAP